MKRNKILIPLFVVLAVLLIAVALFVYFRAPIMLQVNYPELPEELPVETVLTAEQVTEDREQMINSVENIHPYFLLEEDLSDYEAAKEKYISQTTGEMTVGDFRIATAEYLCFFGDGHTGAKWYEEKYLDISWEYHEDGLYLLTENTVSDESAKLRVESIGGVASEVIFAQIDRIRSAENEIAHIQNYENFAGGENILLSLGAQIADDKTVVTFTDGSQQEYSFVDPYAVVEEKTDEAENTDGAKEADDAANFVVNSCYMQGDVFVVDFNSCEVNEELESIAKQMEEAVKGGTTKFIIDARGNGGGNSDACVRLLNALGMEAPQYDMFVRYSEEAAKQNGYIWKSGQVCYEGADTGKANDKVELVVLCDRETFSSATMLLVFVRDAGLGTIIGEPSANMPSAYGDIIYFTLDNSHVWGTISHKRFIRPDGENEERMLIPDIQTEPEDALEEALKYLNQ